MAERLASDESCELFDGSVFGEGRGGKRDVERFFNAREHLQRLERVSAELEKILVPTNARNP